MISERIFNLLAQKGMKQSEFSEQTGISQSTIADWKRKKTNPSSDKIMLICDILNVTPYYLLSGIESDNHHKLNYVTIDKDSEEYSILECFWSLDINKRNRLQGYMASLSEDV